MKQQSFGAASDEFKDYWKNTGKAVHGGVYSVGKRKTKRTLSTKRPIHVVLRSSRAKGTLSLRSKQIQIKKILDKYSNKFNITVYKFSNNSNHLHLLVRSKDKVQIQHFLRSLSGHIARLMTGAKKGVKGGKFWDHLTFTRIGHWGKAYMNLKKYVIQNILEAAGIVEYKPRKHKLIKMESGP